VGFNVIVPYRIGGRSISTSAFVRRKLSRRSTA
jgi:hypothetical protein